MSVDGPLLSVTRLDDGGDGVTSGDRYLDIGDEPESAAVTGAATVTAEDGSALPLTLEATCP